MKKTQCKDFLRNIKKQIVSFLSILIISAIGVTTFLGIDFTASSMRKNGSEIYNRCNFRDLELVSTRLFSAENLEQIRSVEGVAAVEGVRTTEATATADTKSQGINVVTLTEVVNRAELVSGAYPQNPNECAVEQTLAEEMGLELGQTLTLTGSDGGNPQFLSSGSFTICGIVNHPDHINKIVPDPLYAIVTWDAFDGEQLPDGWFMKAEVVIEKPENVNRFSKSYEKSVVRVAEKIGAIEHPAVDEQGEELLLFYMKPYQEAIRAESETLTPEAKAALDEASGSADALFAFVRGQLADGFDQLEEGKATIRDAIRDAYEDLLGESDDVSWATVRTAEVDNPDETARYLEITADFRLDVSYFRGMIHPDSLSENLLVAIYKVASGKDAPTAGDGYDIEAICRELAGSVPFADGVSQLIDGCDAWDAAHARYLGGLEQYNATLKSIGQPRWLSFDMSGNSGFVQLNLVSGNFSNLKMTFSMMFVLVAALVIFATVGKMVDEQRSLIGTTKALGFFNREIFLKYLGFGVSATLIGTLLGILLARFAIQPFLLGGGFSRFYAFPIAQSNFFATPATVAVLAGILLAVIAIWFACSKLVKEPAIRLMQPKSPGVKKGTGKVRGLTLYSRLILLNMRTDLKRVVVTIVSVAGCCALVVIGFTLRSAIVRSPEKQYGEIIRYEQVVQFDPGVDGAEEKIAAVLEEAGTESVELMKANMTFQIRGLQVAEILCGDIRKLETFRELKDPGTGEPLYPTNEGVLIQRRYAEVYDLGIGSTFEIYLGGTRPATVRVAGVFDNYIGRTMVMSSAYYETLFGDPCEPNLFLVRLNGADSEKLAESLRGIEGFMTVSDSDSDRSLIEDSVSVINIVVLLFIFIAAVMAGIVLLNLTNMYILQKKRELTIMRINGFRTGETIEYVLRETIVTTVLGILLGIGTGSGLGYLIVRTLEQPFIRFYRGVDFAAWAYAIAITLLFTTIVNVIALRKVKDLKLTDVA